MDELRRKVSALLISGFTGTSLPHNFLEQITQTGLGGIILFSRNYENTEQLKRLTAAIAGQASPPLVAIDQEGGRVVRFSGDFPVYPSPDYYGRRKDREGFLEATDTTARNLRALGVNLNLIPTCDLAPADPDHVIASRSYSADPELLAEIVAAQVTCLHEADLICCAKHFPGLASASGDPHLMLSSSGQSRRLWRERDYLPFAAAISAGVDLVMITHLTAAAVDADNPATFSKSFVQDELRGYLGYEGLVITDDLQMQAVSRGRSAAEVGAAAIRAGCDLLIYGDLSRELGDLIESLARLAETDARLADRIDESFKRVSSFKLERGDGS